MDTVKPTSHRLSQIPVIDFSHVNDSSLRASIVTQLACAFENFGFVEVVNSFVPMERLDSAFNVNREFFELPLEKRKECYLDHEANKPKVLAFQIGWIPGLVGRGITSHKELFLFRSSPASADIPATMRSLQPSLSESIGDHDHADRSMDSESKVEKEMIYSALPNVYPTGVPHYREKVDDLMESLGEFGDQLLDLISESLGLPTTFVREQYHDNSVRRKLLMHFYPKSTMHDVDEAGNQIGLRAHSDTSIISIVGEGFGTSGLQINVTGEEWIPVMPSRGGLIINVGDILQVWTNGRYRSILHRVINNRDKDRFSFAYFISPSELESNEFVVKPIQELITAQSPQRYKPFTYHQYYERKFSKGVNLMVENEIGV